ncbi:DUF6238 family protein [Streptomyces sp. NPDC004111]|uniref:DUF6238 family protein n=1 Tax=Streptomyces sp. NPDC004111 TaxID=3364690 RepID=UPI0036D04FB2
MSSPRTADEAHPYLRAATAGLRHHTTAIGARAPLTPRSVDRVHLDTLHSHLTALHRLLDQLTDSARPRHPAAGAHLATAHTRLWQAATAAHDAFHTLPHDAVSTPGAAVTECRPDRLPDGSPVLTICQRHVSSGHAIRRKTTARDLEGPPHGHTTHCGR